MQITSLAFVISDELKSLGNGRQFVVSILSGHAGGLEQGVMIVMRKCRLCGTMDRGTSTYCSRCDADLPPSKVIDTRPKISLASRISVVVMICVAALLALYVSLVFSAKPLSGEQKSVVEHSIGILEDKGFTDDAALLRSLAIFRGSDNWLNSSVAKENAYAATNFPFEIMTLYPDFFTYPMDDVERAAILLHEAQHLKGADEQAAYTYVWKHRQQLGWTRDKYIESPVWINVRRQTKEEAPNIFVCDQNEFGDCTEN